MMFRTLTTTAGLVVLFLAAAFGNAAHAATEKAIVAGGCFWCVESDFEKVPGVKSVVSGYTGGSNANPTYKDHDGHYEAVDITFDNSKISYG
jgi:peptide-methionine (S)-S-oxide reductase